MKKILRKIAITYYNYMIKTCDKSIDSLTETNKSLHGTINKLEKHPLADQSSLLDRSKILSRQINKDLYDLIRCRSYYQSKKKILEAIYGEEDS